MFRSTCISFTEWWDIIIIIVSMQPNNFVMCMMFQVKLCTCNVTLSCTGVAKRHANREFPDLKVTFEGTPYFLSGLLKDSDR